MNLADEPGASRTETRRPNGAHAPGGRQIPTSSTRPSATVLVVDDDKGVTQTFARMLRFEGYQVHTATGEEGLIEAKQRYPDAIILDLRMPLVDGLGFLRRLRATISALRRWRS